ncbi:unnamed protein product [Leptosia nina]|uniref:Uncharacterized protein n=1 Tax=Leptosia nina TaxID=320188 RepID=A0AAV1IUK9_9NEOP
MPTIYVSCSNKKAKSCRKSLRHCLRTRTGATSFELPTEQSVRTGARHESRASLAPVSVSVICAVLCACTDDRDAYNRDLASVAAGRREGVEDEPDSILTTDRQTKHTGVTEAGGGGMRSECIQTLRVQ